MVYLNVGCGNNFHPDWINIDIVSSNIHVIAHDLTAGIPMPDSTVQVVYHSHVLEHLRRPEAYRFIQECYRLLQPGGILRVVVPDLEQICRLYIEKLNLLTSGSANPEVDADYEWMMLELYDQTTREQSGGRMLSYLRQGQLVNKDFILERIGDEGRHLMQVNSQQEERAVFSGTVEKLNYFSRVKQIISGNLFLIIRDARDYLVATLLGKNNLKALKIGRTLLRGYVPVDIEFSCKRALEIGYFRLSGEVHQWMYDKYSLRRLLQSVGFQEISCTSATDSRINNWSDFHLDTLPDGTVRKPDSLFMEAVKPSNLL